jgi:hypothetical protein
VLLSPVYHVAKPVILHHVLISVTKNLLCRELFYIFLVEDIYFVTKNLLCRELFYIFLVEDIYFGGEDRP